MKIAIVGVAVQGKRALLQKLCAQLAAHIEHMRQARNNLAAILRHDAPPESPSGFESVPSRLSESDRSLLHKANQSYNEDAMTDLRWMVEPEGTDGGVAEGTDGGVAEEIDALPADADEVTRKLLAASLAPTLVQHLVDCPWLANPAEHLSKSKRGTQLTFVEAFAALYNPAQLDVLERAGVLTQDQLHDADRIGRAVQRSGVLHPQA